MRNNLFIRRWSAALLFLAGAVVFLALRLEMPAALSDRLFPPAEPAPFTNAAFWGVVTEPDWKGFPHKTVATNAPWGRLDTVRIELEFPDRETQVGPEFWAKIPWVFEVESTSMVLDVFERARLTQDQKASLRNPSRISGTRGIFTVEPDPATLLGLSAESRSIIYHELAKSDLNPFHRTPFSVPREFFQGWLADSGLDEGVQDQVRKLSYARGDAMCFSDLHVFAQADEATKSRLMLTLSRVPSLVANLKVDAHSDVAALARYWGAGGREREVRGMLEASAHGEGGSRIQLASLLPRFARTRLYTYPQVKRSPERPGPDCFWSSLNFFNDNADEAAMDEEGIPDRLDREFSPADGPLQFGDMVVLKDYRGMYLHACVFIADGLVFTKNGASYHQPWTLQNLDDMLHGYLITQEPGRQISVEVYRPKMAGFRS